MAQARAADDPSRVLTRAFPAAEARVCVGEGAADVWRTLRFKRRDLRGLTVCYQAAPNRKAFVVSASDHKIACCLHGKDGPKVSAPEAVADAKSCALAGDPTIARRPEAAKVLPAHETEKKTGTPAEPSPPDPAIVASLCLDWEASVEKFGDACPALGKRLQRSFRAYSIDLRSVPRDGPYKEALARCTKSAKSKAMSSCAKDKDVKAALKLIGN